jgi:hypothetical protein
MSGKATASETEGSTGSKAASCGCATWTEAPGCCGGEMRQMMARFMAPKAAGEEKPAPCGEEGANDHEDE